jgi:hypothetical protein
MNASSRIKVDNELRAEPDSLRCLHTNHGRRFTNIRLFLREQSSQRRAYFLSTAKALSMPMPGALDDGSFSIQGL